MYLNNIIIIPVFNAFICLQYQILFIMFTLFQKKLNLKITTFTIRLQICTHLNAVRSAVRQNNVAIVARNTTIALLDVVCNMFTNHLNADRFRIRAHATALATLEDCSSAFLSVLWITRIIQQFRRDRKGQHLSQKCDGLLAHRVSISHVCFDHLIKRFLDPLQKGNTILDI